ncbi:DUF6069 family protein [Streptomyces sp. NPDC086182]|uniref:DUF6069 family protein n=1 Tax=Streptomyces sp. NPDC086182 TaxID=3155058 RepID=UPI00341227A7
MSRTASLTSQAGSPEANRRALWWPGLALAVVGAAAATAVAAAARAAGASLEIAGEPTPLPDFAQLGFVCSVVGVVLAAACRRWAGRPARAFVRVTVPLVVLSFLPDLLIGDVDAATRVTLVLTHVAAAVIVVPGIRSRLR